MTGTYIETTQLRDTADAVINPATDETVTAFAAKVPELAGEWGYAAGTAGTATLTGGKRVLQITAVALEAAGTITIDGGDTITIPYGSSDSVSTSITIEPRGNLTDPTLIFTGTHSYFVEFVT